MLKKIAIGINTLSCVAIATGFLSTHEVNARSISLNKAVQLCAEISIDKERLTCFDRLAVPLADSSVVPVVKKAMEQDISVAMANVEGAQSPKKLKEIDDFAKEHLVKTAEQKTQELNSIELTISKLKKLIRGEWKITFANGQIWQQKGSERIKLKVGDKVVLDKGALSVIYLKKLGFNKRIRVKRLK